MHILPMTLLHHLFFHCFTTPRTKPTIFTPYLRPAAHPEWQRHFWLVRLLAGTAIASRISLELPVALAFSPPLLSQKNAAMLSIKAVSDNFRATPQGSELTTTRVPLERIFNGEREYLFTTRRNLRGYEWGIEEVEELFESISSLRGEGGEASTLELNAITIMPAAIPDGCNIGRTSQLFDVHDGQQRLVTLCILLAALRDNFFLWGKIYKEDALEIANAIYPQKRRLDPVPRIQIRERNKTVLNKILENDGNGDEALRSEQHILISPKSRKQLPKSEQCIVNAYEYLHGRVKELGPEKSIELLDDFNSGTFVLVCIPATTRIARSIVMGLGKGKNLEPVDEFKGIVCFNCIADEHRQDEALEKWNELCEEVGRETLENICLLSAQIALRKPLRKNSEVDLFEDYISLYLRKNEIDDGYQFFHQVLSPRSKILKKFYDCQTSLERKNGKIPSLSFLLAATQIRTAKEIETVVLHFLVRLESALNEFEIDDIEDDLQKLESIALWMILTKPKPAERRNRCFEIIDMDKEPKVLKYFNPLELTAYEKESILTCLKLGEFGKGASSKIAKAILERLNEYQLITSSQVQRIQHMQFALQLEHVLPQKHSKVKEWSSKWDEDNADLWMHRLGNLALLNQKLNGKISNGSFSEKRKSYKTSPYPMTRLIGDYKKWEPADVEMNHCHIVSLAVEVWGLVC